MKTHKIMQLLMPAIKNYKFVLLKMLQEGSIHILLVILAEFIRRFIIKIELGISTNELIFQIIFLFIISLSTFLIYFFTHKINTEAVLGMKSYIFSKYIKKYIMVNSQIADDFGKKTIASILEPGMKNWVNSLEKILFHMFGLIIAYISFIILIANINLYIAIIILFLTIFLSIIVKIINKKMIFSFIQNIPHEEEISKSILRIISKKFSILKYKKISSEIQNIKDNIYIQKDNTIRAEWYIGIIFRGTNLIIDLIQISILFLMGWYMYNENYLIADISIMLFSIAMLRGYSAWFLDMWQQVGEEYPKIERMLSVFDDFEKIKGYNKGNKYLFKGGEIIFKNVDFKYDNKEILKNFSFKIGKNKNIAIVGHSGVGKTTILKLILGFIEPTLGSIYIDGQNLRTISLKSVYSCIGYLKQEPEIFDGTIYENVTYGLQKKVSIDIVYKILKKAQCNFVFELEEGIYTKIGDNYKKLSGGQKQLIAIARVLLENPKIVLLDEPTGTLDAFTESKIIKSLKILFKNRTIITIAHRLSTIKNAGEIIVLGNHGKIINRGTHEKLLEQNSIYAKMWNLQS